VINREAWNTEADERRSGKLRDVVESFSSIDSL